MNEEIKKEEKVPDMKNNFYDAIIYQVVFKLQHGELDFSIGAGFASRIIDKVREKVKDANFVLIGETDCIFYSDVDAHKVVEALNQRKKVLTKKMDEYTRAIAKVVTKRK